MSTKSNASTVNRARDRLHVILNMLLSAEDRFAARWNQYTDCELLSMSLKGILQQYLQLCTMKVESIDEFHSIGYKIKDKAISPTVYPFGHDELDSTIVFDILKYEVKIIMPMHKVRPYLRRLKDIVRSRIIELETK